MKKAIVVQWWGEELRKHPISYYRTFCLIEREDNGTPIAIATADCSRKDEFSQFKGEKTALDRALKQTMLSKTQRAEVWKQFLDEWQTEQQKRTYNQGPLLTRGLFVGKNNG